MASFTKHFPSILFIVLLFSLPVVLARDSQFFSKFTNTIDNERETTTVFPNKEDTALSREETLKKMDQDPTFIPEDRNAYGLYGHKFDDLPFPQTESMPFTTNTNDLPVSTEPDWRLFGNSDRNDNNIHDDNNNNNANYYYKNNEFANEFQNTDHVRPREAGHIFNDNIGNGYNNVKQEGMSDTRFLENGRYFYDINNEKPNSYFPFGYQNTGMTQSRDINNDQFMGGKRFYFGNSENNNGFDRPNMDGFKNQQVQDVQEDQFVP